MLSTIGLVEKVEVAPLGNPETLRVALWPAPFAVPVTWIDDPCVIVPAAELREIEVTPKFAVTDPDPPTNIVVEVEVGFETTTGAVALQEVRKYGFTAVALMLYD